MRTKNKWPDEPEPGETIRRLNWFMEVGFVIENIDFSRWQEQITMSGDCVPDDIGTNHTEGGPFLVEFIGIRHFSIQNIHLLRYEKRLLLKSPRDFTIEKYLAHKRYYHLKTYSPYDGFGFEIDFEKLEICRVSQAVAVSKNQNHRSPNEFTPDFMETRNGYKKTNCTT